MARRRNLLDDLETNAELPISRMLARADERLTARPGSAIRADRRSEGDCVGGVEPIPLHADRAPNGTTELRHRFTSQNAIEGAPNDFLLVVKSLFEGGWGAWERHR